MPLKSSPDRIDGAAQLTIGEAARRAGIATSAIRYYESIGLLPEPLRQSGQRRYDESIVGRLAFIDIAQQAGFTLRQVAELLEAGEAHARMADTLQELSARKLSEIQSLIERAETMKGWLEVAGSCTCESPEQCTLFPTDAELSRGQPVVLDVVLVDGRGCRRA